MCNSYDLQFVISLCSSCTEWQLRHNWVDIRNMVTNSIGELSPKLVKDCCTYFSVKASPSPKPYTDISSILPLICGLIVLHPLCVTSAWNLL